MKQSITWARFARTLRGGTWFIAALVSAAAANGQVAPRLQTVREQADTLLREALDRKVYGLDEEQSQLLDRAAELDPANKQVQWQRARRQASNGLWVDADATDPAKAEQLEAYRLMRSTLANTVADQTAAADWCREQKLPDHERAHLLNVLDIAPDHEPTLLRLGYRPVRGGWESPAARTAKEAGEKAAKAALAKWHAQVAALRDELNNHSRRHRHIAADRLQEIADADAIPIIDAAIASDSQGNALVVVEWLRQFNDQRAVDALARHAVFSRWSDVRKAAKRGLKQYPLEAFVPAMLTTMRSPVAARVVAKPIRGGIDYDLVLTRETQDAREREELNTIIPSTTFAVDLQRDNARTLLTNQAVSETLCSLTDEKLPANPQAWWQWWDRYNEVYVEGEKPIRDYSKNLQLARLVRAQDFEREQARIAAEERRIERERQAAEDRRRQEEQVAMWNASGGTDPNGNPLRRKDCLAAGTLVWTVDGPVAVELLQMGDLVLAQDVDTGELAHKLVLRTTVRKKSILVKIETANETYATSGGHPFWVVGRGWVKARELKSGDLLHTLRGTAAISTVAEGEEAETYNLVVDGFSSYFIGRTQVLTHDNTPRAVTFNIVPGMRGQ